MEILETAVSMYFWSKTSRWRTETFGSGWLPVLAAFCRVSVMLEGKGSSEASPMFDAPALANEWAVARPMPLDAPVMKME